MLKCETAADASVYAYDGLERLSERKSGEASQVFHYGGLGDMPTYLANGEGAMTRSYVQGGGGLAEQREGEATSFPLLGSHGEVTALTGAEGKVESRQSYGPWGEVLEGPGYEMGYLGAYERPTDHETGLIQMGARSYDPGLGAFLSEDPLGGTVGNAASQNHYPYAWGNPTGRYDLSGRNVCGAASILGPVIEGACKALDSGGESGEPVGEAEYIAERAPEFAKGAKNWLTHINPFPFGSSKPCESKMVASTNKSFLPCSSEEVGAPEEWDNNPGVPIIPSDPQHPVPVEPSIPRIPAGPGLRASDFEGF